MAADRNILRGACARSANAARAFGLGACLILSGFLLSLTGAPESFWWLGWICLLPLFEAIRVSAPRRAMGYGALWGVCLYAFSIFASSTGQSAPLWAPALMIAIPAVYACAGAHVVRRIGFSPFVLAFGWIGVEFALTPLGLRHGLLARTQGDGALIHVVGGLLGYVFVAFLIVLVNASLLAVLSKLSIPSLRQRLSTGLSDLEGYLGSRTTICISRLALGHACPRGPPVASGV